MTYSHPKTFVYVYTPNTPEGKVKDGYNSIQTVAWALSGHWGTEAVRRRLQRVRPDLIGQQFKIDRCYYYSHKPSYYDNKTEMGRI